MVREAVLHWQICSGFAKQSTKREGKPTMKASFWDVKNRANVEAEVLDCIQYPNGRYAFKAKTADGRSLTRFVSKADAEAFKPAGKCCKKSCKK